MLCKIHNYSDSANTQCINNFEDQVHDAAECFYDLNGNLVRDNNRNLQNIDYNYLNLPQ